MTDLIEETIRIDNTMWEFRKDRGNYQRYGKNRPNNKKKRQRNNWQPDLMQIDATQRALVKGKKNWKKPNGKPGLSKEKWDERC